MAEQHVHPPTKILVTIGIIVGFWIIVTFIILGAFGIHQGWPAFLALPLFFIAGGADKKQLINIFVGGAAGILICAAIAPVVGFLAKYAGLNVQLAILLTIFVFIVIIVGFGGIVPVVFNSFNLVYFTVAVIFPQQDTLRWLVTLVLGGAIFVGGTLLCMRYILPLLIKAEPPSIDA